MTEGIHSIHTGKRIEDDTDAVLELIKSLTEDTD